MRRPHIACITLSSHKKRWGLTLLPTSFPPCQPFPSQFSHADVQEAYGRSGTPAPLLTDDAGPRMPEDPTAAEAAAGSTRVRREGVTPEEWAALSPQLGGFCPVTLVRRNGLPLRGEDPRNGRVSEEWERSAIKPRKDQQRALGIWLQRSTHKLMYNDSPAGRSWI
jgi:hypothetical protein